MASNNLSNNPFAGLFTSLGEIKPPAPIVQQADDSPPMSDSPKIEDKQVCEVNDLLESVFRITLVKHREVNEGTTSTATFVVFMGDLFEGESAISKDNIDEVF
jgi:hypothetical protein